MLESKVETTTAPDPTAAANADLCASAWDDLRSIKLSTGQVNRLLIAESDDRNADYDHMTTNQRWDYDHMTRKERWIYDHMTPNKRWEYDHMTTDERWDHDHQR